MKKKSSTLFASKINSYFGAGGLSSKTPSRNFFTDLNFPIGIPLLSITVERADLFSTTRAVIETLLSDQLQSFQIWTNFF